ncbi:MAG: hypothetical protein RBG13Loki_4396 [Promethearchaeota archaeon CR_4]|nr:MAG: hypothetical protein RBG13Loki_4396 [Candidatus Lokiarchaeota archaeon CR_4]
MSKAILIVGFNSRPIAKSLHSAGFSTFAVDFFGDWDLVPVTDDFTAVAPFLEQGGTIQGNSQRNFQEIMVDLAAAMVKKHPQIQGCLLGSGFDDRSDLVEDLNSITPLIGTNVKGLKVARDFQEVRRIAIEAGFQIPKTISVTHRHAFTEIPLPWVLTPKHSSGGLSKRLIHTPGDLQKEQDLLSEIGEDLVVEEFVTGYPMSCAFIKTGETVKIVAINDQIIGDPSCNPPGVFYYCGNVTPTRAPEFIVRQAHLCCQRLAELLPVQGINGIDFVGTADGIYFMEVNPRIPGSLAPIEAALDRTILDVLFLSPMNLQRRNFQSKYTAIKHILYAPQTILPARQVALRRAIDICDIPSGERIIEKGEPICTVLTRGKNFIKTVERTLYIGHEVYTRLFPK